MTNITDFILNNEKTTVGLDTSELRFLYVTFLPRKANASSGKDQNGKDLSWFQLVSNYETSYDRVDENGVVYEDENSTQKTFILKIPYNYIKKYNLTTNELITFFRVNFVNKKFITLPIIEETPVFEYRNNQRNLVKNQSQAFINEEFNLKEFIKNFEKVKK